MAVIAIGALASALENDAAYNSAAEMQMASVLKKAICNDDYSIGEFEWTPFSSMDDACFDLPSGDSLVNYLGQLTASAGWYVFRLVRPIKGDFEKLVYFREYAGFGRQQCFLATPGSRWVLILKPALDHNSKILTPDRYNDADLRQLPFLNRRNLFRLHEQSAGAICLHWPSDGNKPENIQVYPETLSAELELLVKLYAARGKNSPAQNKYDGISIPLCKRIANEILEGKSADQE
jgi:hypothetical protein